MNKIVVSVGRKLQTNVQYENMSIFTSLEIETPEEVGSDAYNSSYANLWVKAYEEIDKQEKALDETIKAKPKTEPTTTFKYATKPEPYKPITEQSSGNKSTKPATEKQISAARKILIRTKGSWPAVNKYVKDTFNKKITELNMAEIDQIFQLIKKPETQQEETSVLCEQCGKEITDGKVVEYSQQKYNTILCRDCQKSYQNIEQ